MHTFRPLRAIALAGAAIAALAAGLPAAHAEIVIGMASGFTGAVATGVRENHEGAALYIEAVNKRGGIHGEQLVLRTLDDEFDPRLTAAHGRKLAAGGAIALFLSHGTAQTEALLPVLAEHGIPLVAPSTGAMSLHQPVNPLVFNVRATYQRESARAVNHLVSVGITRIAIIHTDDSFGADAAQGGLAALDASRLKPTAIHKFQQDDPDYSLMALAVTRSNAQAVIFIGPARTVANGVKTLRAGASGVQVVTLSNNASGGFIKLLHTEGPGVVVTQVFPNERTQAIPIAREAAELLKGRDGGELTPAVMEGFAAAKVLVEGLRRAGPRPTRARLVQALDGLSNFDIGGMNLSYNPTDHTGFDFTDLSIIASDGRFRR